MWDLALCKCNKSPGVPAAVAAGLHFESPQTSSPDPSLREEICAFHNSPGGSSHQDSSGSCSHEGHLWLKPPGPLLHGRFPGFALILRT